ncbi:MAG TPA: C4-dicarboxylate ABC transporter [Hyphomonas sp.]|nr:C4-dicarboxylate ABC transporter [Hyphomonas sp.]|tara:strand:+ start:25131 stop:26438 length:1308 start_codon:yes stop_codon:yes gene_type:complete
MSVATGFVAIAVLLGLLVLRIPIAFAMILVAFGGVVTMLGLGPAIGLLASGPYDFAASWTLSAVPMFLLMGFICYHTGMTTGLFAAANVFLRRVPGGLAISSVLACSGFASVCGSSVACAAAMGRIAIPEMVRSGYKPSFACGTVAAGGTIGALIPPSILMIIFGVFAQTSVTKVFLGGISIGLLTAASYVTVILIVSALSPDTVPRRDKTENNSTSTRDALIGVWPILLIVFIVFGGMFSGLFTATEAGAIGASAAVLIAFATRTLNRRAVRDALIETLTTTSALFLIAIGAALFTRFLGLSGTSRFIVSFVTEQELSYPMLMLGIVVIYLLLGMFMEPFGAMLVTLPVFLPVIEAQGLSLIWFGVLVVKLLEIGMITPPVGMNVFVIRSVASNYASLGAIFRGVVNFLVADLVVIVLIITLPALVLWLPDLLG